MSTPTQRLEPAEKAERLGWVSHFAGDATDDFLMVSTLAETLIATDRRASAVAWAPSGTLPASAPPPARGS
jgi:hypothetical protein